MDSLEICRGREVLNYKAFYQVFQYFRFYISRVSEKQKERKEGGLDFERGKGEGRKGKGSKNKLIGRFKMFCICDGYHR